MSEVIARWWRWADASQEQERENTMPMAVTWRMEAATPQDAVDQLAAEFERRGAAVRESAERMKGYDAKMRRFHGVTLEAVACKFTEATTLEAQAHWLRSLTVEAPE